MKGLHRDAVLEYADSVVKRPPLPAWHATLASVTGVFAGFMAMTRFVWLGFVLVVWNVWVTAWIWLKWRERCRRQRSFAFVFFWSAWCRSFHNSARTKSAQLENLH